MSNVNVDTVIGGFVKLRDKRAELKKAWAVEDDALKYKQDKLEAYLLNLMQESGAAKLGSASGTAYQQIKSRASSQDWSATWDWLASHQRLDMLEKRVSTKVVQEYFEETGELPDGVRIEQELKVTIRRS